MMKKKLQKMFLNDLEMMLRPKLRLKDVNFFINVS